MQYKLRQYSLLQRSSGAPLILIMTTAECPLFGAYFTICCSDTTMGD